MYTPVQPDRLYQRIVEQIESRILRGELRQGDRLPTERELADQFRVSRTAVREATKALAQKGLIEMRPGRGTFIIDRTAQLMWLSIDTMMKFGQGGGSDELVEVRELLEPEIAAIAAERASPAQIEALQVAVTRMDLTLDDLDAFVIADNDFHRTLAQSTGNTLIMRIIEPIVDLLQQQRQRIGLVHGGPGRGQYHHKRILEAVIERDSPAAREMMRAHLAQVRADYVMATRAEP